MARYLGIMYKLRTQIPLKARLLIFHSFIQSHLNYCSLVWGLSAKSHIDSLFAKQKSGIRAVMSGYVSYKYNKEDETLPNTHAHEKFLQRTQNSYNSWYYCEKRSCIYASGKIFQGHITP